MAAATKKNTAKKETLTLKVGHLTMKVEPVPMHEVALANARIQKKVQPVFHEIKKTRRAAEITASRLILNA